MSYRVMFPLLFVGLLAISGVNGQGPGTPGGGGGGTGGTAGGGTGGTGGGIVGDSGVTGSDAAIVGSCCGDGNTGVIKNGVEIALECISIGGGAGSHSSSQLDSAALPGGSGDKCSSTCPGDGTGDG